MIRFQKIRPLAMSFISDDVSAIAKREHAHRTRLAGLMRIMLALAISTILPTFKSQISSITSDSRLLGIRDLCNDDCPKDPDKVKPGVCGCGVPDTDTDGDGIPDCKDSCPRDVGKTTPGACGCGNPDFDTDGDGTLDCKDGCPRDATKTSSGICGCGNPDTDTDGDGTFDCHDLCPRDDGKTSYGVCGCGAPDTDTDGDGTLDCQSDCIEDDSSIFSICEANPAHDCDGCGGKYYRLWKECGVMCLSEIDYCLDYSQESWYVYDDSQKYYRTQSWHEKLIQTGADSSNSVFEYWDDCDHDECVFYIYVNGISCIYVENEDEMGACLVCDDGNEYCLDYEVPPLPSNPWFGFGDEALSLVNTCFGWDPATPSQFEMNPIGNKLPQYARGFFNRGA